MSFRDLHKPGADKLLARYTSDYRNLRRTVTKGADTTILLYDLAGNLLAEADGSATGNARILREYVYLEGQRLVRFDLAEPAGTTNESVYWYLNDHLGTAQLILDTAGAIVWQGEHQPFGKVTTTVNTLPNAFRFPGQTLDEETGLHYNWNRSYNPTTGRYISPDPLGLDAGLNLYGYVSGDPINWSDREGLTGFLLPIPGDSTLTAKIKTCARGACSRVELEELLETARFMRDATAVATAIKVFNEAKDETADRGDDESCDNWAQDKKLGKSDVEKLKKKLEEAREGNIESLKAPRGKGAGRLDLYVKPNGDIVVKGKDGKGPGDPTGWNIKGI